MTEWQTLRELFDPLNNLARFKVDAAANESNHLVEKWYGPGSPYGEDALAVPVWDSPAWCNPPYGRGIEKWLDHFIAQLKHGNTVVAILPARVETNWWFDKVVPWANILFLKGRVPFIDPSRQKPSQPDHASALVIYEPNARLAVDWLDWKKRWREEERKGEANSNRGQTETE